MPETVFHFVMDGSVLVVLLGAIFNFHGRFKVIESKVSDLWEDWKVK